MDGVSAQSKREKKPKESPTNNMNVIKINQKIRESLQTTNL